MKGFTRLLVTAMLFATVGLFGCADDGSDGVAGAPGASAYEIAVANGFTGTEAEWLATANANATFPVEACGTCHADGKSVGVDAMHATSSTGDIAVSNIVVDDTTADLIVTFNVALNGSRVSDGYYDVIATDYRLTDVADVMTRLDLSTDDGTATTVTSVTTGTGSSAVTTYTVTIVGGVAANAANNSRYLIQLRNAADAALGSADRPAGYRAIVLFDYPASPVVDALGSTSCADCHGSFGNGFHYGYPSNGGKNCTVCHDATANGNAATVNNFPWLGEMVHGIHSSINMPGGEFALLRKDGTPRGDIYAIAFPSYMNNCSICHETGTPLDTVIAEPMSYDLCISCHGDMTGFAHLPVAPDHSGFTTATNCILCHNGTTVPDTAAGFHNGLTTGRAGLLWDGADASVTEGARVDHQITGVTRTGDDLAITWGATVDGVAVDPCNTTATETAPTFNAGYSVLKAFFQGDDLANADNGASSPGQANSTNIYFVDNLTANPPQITNTVCVGTEATTTITLNAAEAALVGDARVALQGKPKLLFAPASMTAGTTIQVRAKSPTYDFALADGAAAAARRSITDTSLCLNCHVGSLYQHGGNRVDNVDLCVMCHNEASSEQNVREGYGVDATEAYDGKSGQTYGFKSMLHAFHASGEATKPIVIYRSFGIYAFAPTRDMLPNWPGEGSQVIFGSDDGTGTPISKTHNFVTAHYPRNLNDCSACHTSSFSSVPDQTQAIATTVYAGAAPYDNQLDDALQGPAAAACLSCHQSAAAMSHAYKEGWFPTYFENGRQTIIDAAK
jgi:OmcA/MtrC family decaheme c-type cytochrome